VTKGNLAPFAGPGPEHRRLDIFAGQWSKVGQAFGSPFGPAAQIAAVERFEWLQGQLFLVHRLEGHLDDTEIACIEVIGYDASSQSYAVHSFYNDGNQGQWRAQERDGTWTFTGDWPVAGETLKVRQTVVFDDDGRTMTGRWEYSRDGSSWHLFWDTTLTKVT
jgi:hypothetical protein